MKGRPPAKGPGPRRPGAAAPGRARGAAKAARARKPDAPKAAARSTAKAPSAKASGAKPAARPAASSPAKGVSLDVRQFRVAADDDGIRLDRWFQRHLPDIGFNSVSRWARTGQLRVDGARAAPGDRIAEGQTIRVPPAEPKAPASLTRAEMMDRGQRIFSQVCAACHQANAEGLPQVFPPLAKSDFLMADKKRAIDILLQGKSGQITVNGKTYDGVMPQLSLDDASIASVLTYVRNSFGNSGDPVTIDEVKARRH